VACSLLLAASGLQLAASGERCYLSLHWMIGKKEPVRMTGSFFVFSDNGLMLGKYLRISPKDLTVSTG